TQLLIRQRGVHQCAPHHLVAIDHVDPVSACLVTRARNGTGERRMLHLGIHEKRLALAEIHCHLHEQPRVAVNYRIGHGLSDSAAARSAASKPIFECVLSQNGFVCDAPQRQRAIGRPSSGRSKTLPSASISRIGPVTLYGPFSRTLISTISAVALGPRTRRAMNRQPAARPGPRAAPPGPRAD